MAEGKTKEASSSQRMSNIIVRDAGREVWLNQSQLVYSFTVMKAFDYFYGAVEPNNSVVDYSYPHKHHVVGFDDFPVMLSGVADGYETCRQYLDFAQIQPGQHVWDLGGYCGLTAIAFAKAGADVVVVEPDPTNFSACEQNVNTFLEANDAKIDIVNAAVSKRSEMLSFSAEGNTGSAELRIVGAGRGEAIKVQGITLNELVGFCGAPDFIKMDIEGSELDVIQGAGEFFRKHKPRIIIEAHPVGDGPCEHKLVSCLTEYGYTCEVIKQPGHWMPLVTGRA